MRQLRILAADLLRVVVDHLDPPRVEPLDPPIMPSDHDIYAALEREVRLRGRLPGRG